MKKPSISMYCPHCNEPIHGQEVVCRDCGAPLARDIRIKRKTGLLRIFHKKATREKAVSDLYNRGRILFWAVLLFVGSILYLTVSFNENPGPGVPLIPMIFACIGISASLILGFLLFVSKKDVEFASVMTSIIVGLLYLISLLFP